MTVLAFFVLFLDVFHQPALAADLAPGQFVPSALERIIAAFEFQANGRSFQL